jgi:hypothetical protein
MNTNRLLFTRQSINPTTINNPNTNNKPRTSYFVKLILQILFIGLLLWVGWVLSFVYEKREQQQHKPLFIIQQQQQQQHLDHHHHHNHDHHHHTDNNPQQQNSPPLTSSTSLRQQSLDTSSSTPNPPPPIPSFNYKFIGTSIRDASQRGLDMKPIQPYTTWLFSPPVDQVSMEQLQQRIQSYKHTSGSDRYSLKRHAAGILMTLTDETRQTELCPPDDSVPGFVWLEDDAILCNGTIAHINAIMEWFKTGLKPSDEIIYVRTSFGFNGMVVRCAKYREFVQAIIASLYTQGIDYAVSEYLKNKVVTYRWALFSHPIGIVSTLQSSMYSTERDQRVARCFDYNFNTQVPLEYYDSRCLSQHSLVSPCDRYVMPELPQLKVQPPFDTSDLTIHTDEILFSSFGNCDTACGKYNLKCSMPGILRLMKMIRFGIIPTIPRDGISPLQATSPNDRIPACSRTTWITHDYSPPRILDGFCFSRIDDDPFLSTCPREEKGATRFCVCSTS